MSFGFGVGDFLAVGKLAWTVYKSCRDAPESFKNISLEVLSLHAVLKEVEEILAEEPLTGSREQSLAIVTNGCKCILDDLKALVDKYDGMGTQSKITWDRMKWGAKDITELRARLTSNIVLLTAFMSTSQVVVEKQLKKLIREFQEGKHEGSIKTIATVDSLSMDDKQTWRAIRKEFENMGISVAAFDANKGFIMGWFQKAFESGAFEECVAEDDEKSISSQDSLPSETLKNHQAFPDNLIDDQPVNSTSHTPKIKIEQGLVPISSASTPPPTPPEKPIEKQVPTRDSLALANPETLTNQARLVVDSRSEENADSTRDASLSRPQKPLNLREPAIPKKKPRVVSLFAWALRYNKAFHEACQYREFDNAKSLLEKGADINSQNATGSTALEIAVTDWKVEAVTFLLENGADVRTEYQSETVLHLAAKGVGSRILSRKSSSGTIVCDLLLNYGAALDKTDFSGRTPLCIAAFNGYLEIVKTLLDHGANNLIGSPLACATRNRQTSVMQLLLDSQTWTESEKRQEINSAFLSDFSRYRTYTNLIQDSAYLEAQMPYIPPLRLLLEHGANPNSIMAHGSQALCFALSGRLTSLARMLLEYGADPNSKVKNGKSALYCALRGKLNGMAMLLIKRGALVTKQGENLVIHAVKGNCEGALKAMLELGADMKEKDIDGFTALDIAVTKEDLTIAELLVAYGAMNNYKRYAGTTNSAVVRGYLRLAAMSAKKRQ